MTKYLTFSILAIIVFGQLTTLIIAICSIYKGKSAPQSAYIVAMKLLGNIFKYIFSEVNIVMKNVGNSTQRLVALINLVTLLIVFIFGIISIVLFLVSSPFTNTISICSALGLCFLTLIILSIIGIISFDHVSTSF